MGTKKNAANKPYINENIRAKEVRLIDSNGEQLGVLPIRDALNLAVEQGLDLVEVSPNANPPVCKVTDFGKYMFEKEKKDREARKNQKKVEVREIRFSSGIGDHDYNFKFKKALEFLEAGDHVLFKLRYKGREILHTDKGFEVFKKIEADLKETGKVEKPARLEGRFLTMVVAPLKK